MEGYCSSTLRLAEPARHVALTDFLMMRSFRLTACKAVTRSNPRPRHLGRNTNVKLGSQGHLKRDRSETCNLVQQLSTSTGEMLINRWAIFVPPPCCMDANASLSYFDFTRNNHYLKCINTGLEYIFCN